MARRLTIQTLDDVNLRQRPPEDFGGVIATDIENYDPKFLGLEVRFFGIVTSEVEKFYKHAVYCHNLGMPTRLLAAWIDLLHNPHVESSIPRYSIFKFTGEERTFQFLPVNVGMNANVPYELLQNQLQNQRRRALVPEDVKCGLDDKLLQLIVTKFRTIELPGNMDIKHGYDAMDFYLIQSYCMTYFGIALEYQPEYVAPDILRDQFWEVILNPDFDITWVGDDFITEFVKIAQGYKKKKG